MLNLMAMSYFQKSPLLLFPLIALVLFLTVFIIVTVRAMRASPSSFDATSRLPLEATDTEVHDG